MISRYPDQRTAPRGATGGLRPAVRGMRPGRPRAAPPSSVRVGAMAIHPGRHVARIEGDFVVFMIGMRINRPWKLGQWWFVATAMPKMIKELEAQPDSGFL